MPVPLTMCVEIACVLELELLSVMTEMSVLMTPVTLLMDVSTITMLWGVTTGMLAPPMTFAWMVLVPRVA
jgi:hypothetical protein